MGSFDGMSLLLVLEVLLKRKAKTLTSGASFYAKYSLGIPGVSNEISAHKDNSQLSFARTETQIRRR